MFILYDKNKTSGFDRNDLVLQNVTKCGVAWEKNGQYQIDLIYAITQGDIVWKKIIKGAIIKCPVPYQQDQLFRLNTPTKKLDSSNYLYIEVTGYHISYDLNYNFLEDVRPTNMNGLDAGKHILSNTQYPHNFIWNSDIKNISTAYYVRQNVIDALIGDKDQSFVNRWGGELVRDNFSIGMFKQAGQNRGTAIKYSKNLLGLEQSADDSNMITRAMPTISDDSSSTDTGTDGITPVIMIPEKYVDSPLINKYANIYIKEVQVTLTDDQKTLPLNQKYQIMRDYVNNLYSNSHIDIPVYSYTIDFVELAKTEEYKDYAILEEVHPYDFITVKALDIDVIAELVGYTYDSIAKKYKTFTLGNVQNDIIRSNQKSLFQISHQNQQSIKILQAQMGDIPNTILDVATSTTSGGNNLFDHSVLTDNNITEWTNSGASSVTDDSLHSTNKVWELPHGANIIKNSVILNPDNFRGQQLTLSLQAKYNGITPKTYNNNIQTTDVLLGALDLSYKACIASNTTNWVVNIAQTGVISAEYIGVNAGDSLIVNNPNSYVFILHGYDKDNNFLIDFSDKTIIPTGVIYMKVEIIQSELTPENLSIFTIYLTQVQKISNFVTIYATGSSSDWSQNKQVFTLATGNSNDIITQVDFKAVNNDSAGTAYVGAFMINTGTAVSDFSQSSNDTVATLHAHQIVTDYIEAKKADIDQLHVTIATIDDLQVKKANVTDLNATNANIKTLFSDNVSINNLVAKKANISDLTAAQGDISSLKSNKADITQLNATNANITTITGDVATIKNLVSGNITSANMATGAIQAGNAVIANGAISSAQIIELDVAKLKAGIISSDKFVVSSDSGNLKIQGNVIKAWDTKGKERISLGLNGTDYNLLVRGPDGTTVLFGNTGVTHAGITQGAVDDSNVAVGANINGGKIEKESLITSINGATTLMKASRVKLDTEAQTLDVAFTSLKGTVTSTSNTLNSQGTVITAIQGNITNKIWNTDVTTAINNIQVGGRNLLVDSGFELGTAPISTTNVGVTYGSGNNSTKSFGIYGTANADRYACFYLKTPPAGNYIMSFDIKADSTEQTMFNQLFIQESGNGYRGFGGSNISNPVPTTWTRYSFPVIIPSDCATAQVRFVMRPNSNVNNGTIYYDNLKLEQGNKATDWSSAPEDTQAQITTINNNYSTVTQTLGSLTSSIGTLNSKTDTTNKNVTSVNNKVTTLSQNVDGLSSSVTSVQTDYLKKADASTTYATNNSVSTLSQSVSGLSSSITNIQTNYLKSADASSTYATSSTVSSLKQSLSGLRSTVSSVQTNYLKTADASTTYATSKSVSSSISQLNFSISSKVSSSDYNGNNLVSMINQSSSKINISALNINLSGYITATNLAIAGSTTINGANITTGTLTADKISGGTLTLGGSTTGIEIVKNASGLEVARLDKDGLTITFQKVPGQDYFGNAFAINAYDGTVLMNINGNGELLYHGVMDIASLGDRTRYLEFDPNGKITFAAGASGTNSIGLGNGDGASWSTYDMKLSCWDGLAIGSEAPYDGTANFKPKILIDCRTGNIDTFGHLVVAGGKNRAVKTIDYGTRALSAYETAEPSFGDVGRNKLMNGQRIINIDPIFSETANTNIQYEVKTWAYGNGNVWVETEDMYPNYFIVHGSADIEFGYEIIAKQIGYENDRLQIVDM